MMDGIRKAPYFRDARGVGRPEHIEVEGLTLRSYLQTGVERRRARREANLINIITLKLPLNYITLTVTVSKYV